MTHKQEKFERISASNLPERFQIRDPREYIANVRRTVLASMRTARHISVKEASAKTGVPVSEIERVETGKVTASDMALLYSLADLYGADYVSILSVFKLTHSVPNVDSFKFAAYHDPKVGEDAQEAIKTFLSSLRDK